MRKPLLCVYLYMNTRPSAAIYGAFLRIYSVIIKVICFWSLFLVMIHAACNILETCPLFMMLFQSGMSRTFLESYVLDCGDADDVIVVFHRHPLACMSIRRERRTGRNCVRLQILYIVNVQRPCALFG